MTRYVFSYLCWKITGKKLMLFHAFFFFGRIVNKLWLSICPWTQKKRIQWAPEIFLRYDDRQKIKRNWKKHKKVIFVFFCQFFPWFFFLLMNENTQTNLNASKKTETHAQFIIKWNDEFVVLQIKCMWIIKSVENKK